MGVLKLEYCSVKRAVYVEALLGCALSAAPWQCNQPTWAQVLRVLSFMLVWTTQKRILLQVPLPPPMIHHFNDANTLCPLLPASNFVGCWSGAQQLQGWSLFLLDCSGQQCQLVPQVWWENDFDILLWAESTRRRGKSVSNVGEGAGKGGG